MDAHYKPLYRQAAALQNQFHDYSSPMAHDPMAGMLRNQIHGLTNDLARNKDPRMIEKRLKTIQSQLQRTQRSSALSEPGQSPILNKVQTSTLHTNFDRMRSSVRSHPNFF